jgi:hypothetical protein
MFEKIGQMAETMTTKVSLSRRGFFGRLGHAAVGAAGLVGVLLVLPQKAQAAQHVYLCNYACGYGGYSIYNCGPNCPKPPSGCTLTSKFKQLTVC